MELGRSIKETIRDSLNDSLAKEEKTAAGQPDLVSLQVQLERFCTVFEGKVGQAFSELEDKRPKELTTILRLQTGFSSALLEVVTGPNTLLNLLDLIVFVNLALDRIQKHWNPNHFKKDGLELIRVFEEGENDLWAIARTVISLEQEEEIRTILESWKHINPDKVSVERVRLLEAARARGQDQLERIDKSWGLFSNVKEALAAADQGILLASRATYIAQKMPNLARLQARLGADQILSSSLKKSRGFVFLVKAQINDIIWTISKAMIAVVVVAGIIYWIGYGIFK